MAAVGTWSGEVLRHYDPVSPVVAELAGAALVAHRDVENGHGRGKVVLMVYSTFGHAL